MKKLLSIIVFLIFCLAVRATDYYIATTGSDGNSGLIGFPRLHLSSICIVANSPGDVINVGVGTFTETSQSILAPGVNIEGAGVTSIIHSHYVSEDIDLALIQLSSSPGTNGNQHILDLKITGNYSTTNTESAIYITGRRNVEIYNCTFEDFYLRAVTFKGNGTYATGNSFHDNIITNCSAIIPAEGTGQLDISYTEGMTIYDNTFTQTSRAIGTNGYCIKGVGGYNKGTQIYGNTFNKNENEGSKYNFYLELWRNEGGIAIYDNTFNGGGILDIGGPGSVKGSYAYSLDIHDNDFLKASQQATYLDPPATAIDIEASVSNAIIRNNHIKNYGMGISFDLGQVNLYSHDNYVFYNIIENCGFADDSWSHGIIIGGSQSTGCYNNIFIYNNTIQAGATGSSSAGVFIGDYGTYSNIYIRNNIIVNSSTAFLHARGKGGMTLDYLYVQNNLLYNNVNSDDPYYEDVSPTHIIGFSPETNYYGNPLFTSGFHLQYNSPAINHGMNVNLSTDYDGVIVPQGASVDIGALEYYDVIIVHPPIVSTGAITSWTAETAYMGQPGNVTDDGGGTGVTERGICYSTSMWPTIADDTIRLGSGTGTMSPVTITGLLEQTNYHVRAYAVNELGYDSTGYGFDNGFTTPNYPILVIDLKIAVINGKVVILRQSTGSLPEQSPEYSDEMITDGVFAASTYWDLYFGTTVTGGKAVINCTTTYQIFLAQTETNMVSPIQNTCTYKIEFDVSDYVSGSFIMGIGDRDNGVWTSNEDRIDSDGHYEFELTLNNIFAPLDIIFISWDVNPVCKIDNVSLKKKN